MHLSMLCLSQNTLPISQSKPQTVTFTQQCRYTRWVRRIRGGRGRVGAGGLRKVRFWGFHYIYLVGTPSLGRKHSVKHTKQIEKFGALKTSIQSESGVVRTTVLTRWVRVRILAEHFLPSPFALRRLIVNQILGCFGRFVP